MEEPESEWLLEESWWAINPRWFFHSTLEDGKFVPVSFFKGSALRLARSVSDCETKSKSFSESVVKGKRESLRLRSRRESEREKQKLEVQLV